MGPSLRRIGARTKSGSVGGRGWGAGGRSGAALRSARAVPVLGALLLAGCVGDGTTTGMTSGSPAAPSGAAAPAADIAGRWTLSSSAGGACAMTFVMGGPSDGAIRPEGGCPGNFFTSRKWSLDGGALVIRNHNGDPLARLTAVAPTRYEGQTAAGQQLSLVR